MKKIILNTLGLLLILIATISCTKTTNNYYTTNNGTTLTGNVQGIVSLYNDSGGAKILAPNATLGGDSVVLISNSGAVYKTITNNLGTYKFTNVPSGIYNFVVSKPNFGTVQDFGFEFEGGGTAYKNFNMGQIPTTSVVAVKASSSSTLISVSGTITPFYTANYVVVYISLPNTTFVNSSMGNYSYVSGQQYIPAGLTTFTFSAITTNALHNLGFASGSIAYISVYPQNNYSGGSGSYQDPITGLIVYTALGVPAFTSVIVP
ncbi:MAG: carboxypeptidase regulatory-like domain-containing protein [Bacteroidetes bacterium]|nr:carboxypeptidase regulatory-like domain-containing protein [Bacteroidota bacterium]